MRYKLLIGILLMLIIYSCSSKSENSTESDSSESSVSIEETSEDGSSNGEVEEYPKECEFDDGTYSATVDYYNSETSYSAIYTLDVDVQGCQVVQINFPNDGYLDDDHISYADIDEDGNASVEGEDGKTYEIHIEE